MKSEVKMVFQQRLSDLIRSEVGAASQRNTLIAGALLTGTVIAGLIAGPKSALADCHGTPWQCGPDWLNLCCHGGTEQCCWGSWCQCIEIPCGSQPGTRWPYCP